VVDYLPLPEWTTAQLWLTVAAFVIGLGFLFFIANLALSAQRGAPAPNDPWALSELPESAATAPATTR
jgi:heme/copper-type cytochrome/quinol oxidase subunit 1